MLAVRASYEEKLEILTSLRLEERFDKALTLLDRQIKALKAIQQKERSKEQNRSRTKVSNGKAARGWKIF